jgi:hypothetical protein
MSTILPKTQPARWALQQKGAIVYDGLTNVGECTGVNPDYTALWGEGEAAFLAATAGKAGDYKPLPTVGQQVDAGEIYSYAGSFVIARATCALKATPETTPELFVTANAPVILEWVDGEKVDAKWLRTYQKMTYACLKAHVTQKDLTPDVARDLWQPVDATKPDGKGEIA